MFELVVIAGTLAAVSAVLCIGDLLIWIAEKIKPGCIDRLCERIFR